MIHSALYIPLTVYVACLAYLLIGVIRRKEATTATTYARGTGAYRLYIIFATLTATMIGPTYSMGVVDQARQFGYFYTVFFVLSMVQLGIVGYFFAERLRTHASSAITVGELMGGSYGRWTQAFTGIATIAQALAFTGVLCLGSAKVLNAVWSIPIPYGVVATAIVVSSYSVIGGLPAVIKTDILQFFFLCAVLVLGVIATFGLLSEHPSVLSATNIWHIDPVKFPTTEVISVAIGFFLGEAFIPIYSVRALVALDGSTAKKAFIYTAIFGVIWFVILTLFGIASHSIQPDDGLYKIALFEVVARISSTEWISAFSVGIAAAGILGIAHSTLDSVLHSGAISLVRDLMHPFMKLSDKEILSYERNGMLLIAIFGSTLAFASSSLVDILFIGYSVWVPTVVVPLAALLLGKVRHPIAGLAGIAAGVIGYVVGSWAQVPMMPPLLVGLLSNLMVFVGVNSLLKSSTTASATITRP